MDEAYEASGGTAARLLGNAFSASEELRADVEIYTLSNSSDLLGDSSGQDSTLC